MSNFNTDDLTLAAMKAAEETTAPAEAEVKPEGTEQETEVEVNTEVDSEVDSDDVDFEFFEEEETGEQEANSEVPADDKTKNFEALRASVADKQSEIESMKEQMSQVLELINKNAINDTEKLGSFDELIAAANKQANVIEAQAAKVPVELVALKKEIEAEKAAKEKAIKDYEAKFAKIGLDNLKVELATEFGVSGPKLDKALKVLEEKFGVVYDPNQKQSKDLVKAMLKQNIKKSNPLGAAANAAGAQGSSNAESAKSAAMDTKVKKDALDQLYNDGGISLELYQAELKALNTK